MAKLLIVDDDTSVRTFLKLAIQRDGHYVMEASDGEACLTIAQQESLDMILLDAQMPGMDGFTCSAELKATLRDRCPPIIMITGLADKASVDRAFSVGATDYTTKPVHLSVLRHRIHRVLRERELSQHLAAVNQELAAANRELQRLARVDSLTQVANRRCFQETLKGEWARSARLKDPLGVLLCDVDYFKQYNDLYGHLAGDRCLKDISRLLCLSVLRPADFVARYGGEEFVILLPHTDAPGTRVVAERIHTAINNMAIPHGDSHVSSCVTLSIGATSAIPNLQNVPESLIERADKALYLAKENGRNQTVLDLER